MTIATAIAAIALSYLLGSIPFGVIIGKTFKGIDIRTTGSGNIGTSNAFRALGPAGGSLVFLADTLKGTLPAIAAGFFWTSSPDIQTLLQIAAGIGAILGHNFSIFLKFKGGKGIATSFGVFLALNWQIALICLAIWLIIVGVTKISSLASITGAIALPTLAFCMNENVAFKTFAIIAALLGIWMHRENIKRLLNGSELKMSTKETKNVTVKDNK